MPDVKWIKITTDMFDNRKIKQIRGLPEGNNIVLVWIMLLTIAGKCNAGGMIFLTENIPYTVESLARELNFDSAVIKLALEALSSYGMIVCTNEEFSITNWDEYQNIEGMEKIREQNRQRQKRWYDNKKTLPEPNVRSNVSITQPNGTDIEEDIEKELDTEKEGDIEKDKRKKSKKDAPPKHKYGEFSHVLLADAERDKLFDEFGNEKTTEAIKFLDEYIEEKRYKSNSHYMAMRRWVFDAVEERKAKQRKPQSGKIDWDSL